MMRSTPLRVLMSSCMAISSGSSLLEDAARIGVDALGIFANHDEVHVFRLDALQRAQRRIEQAHRAHVGVEIHLEAHAQQNFLGVNVRLHPRIAECARRKSHRNRAPAWRIRRAEPWSVAQIAVGAPVELSELDRRAGGLNDLNRLRNHFLADPVAGDDGDPFLACVFRVHGRNVNTIAIIEYSMGPTALAGTSEGIGAAASANTAARTTAARSATPQEEFAALRNGAASTIWASARKFRSTGATACAG